MNMNEIKDWIKSHLDEYEIELYYGDYGIDYSRLSDDVAVIFGLKKDNKIPTWITKLVNQVAGI